jgi:uncharacterized DUF497 family protein
MKFAWDDKKNQANYDKHSIWFEEAQTVWLDINAIEFYDPEHRARHATKKEQKQYEEGI